MSQHKSLKADKYKYFRTVRTRRERVEKLMRNLKWVEGQSPFGLPKEIIRKIKKKIKKETKKVELTPSASIAEPSTKKKKTSRDDKETSRR